MCIKYVLYKFSCSLIMIVITRERIFSHKKSCKKRFKKYKMYFKKAIALEKKKHNFIEILTYNNKTK